MQKHTLKYILWSLFLFNFPLALLQNQHIPVKRRSIISRKSGLSLLFISMLLKLRSHGTERETIQAKAKAPRIEGFLPLGNGGREEGSMFVHYHLNLMVLGMLTSCTLTLYNL